MTQEPTLAFFRRRPDGWLSDPSVPSSLQSFETSLFLIALGRYPHALTLIVSAIESCLQGANLGSTQRDGFQQLVEKARTFSSPVGEFSAEALSTLGRARNRFIHQGFSPHDDPESVSLYLDTALPFLVLCYGQFHAFDFMEGLLEEYAYHVLAAQKVHRLAKSIPDSDISYCVRALVHSIRWSFKENFSSGWESETLIRAEEVGGKFELTYSAKQRLERGFGMPWAFDCPICFDVSSAVADMDPEAFDRGEIQTGQLACVNCGFTIHADQPFLSEVLLHEQIASSKQAILESFI